MNFKSNIFVTYASQYELENGTKGLTVNYFMLDENNRMNNKLVGPTRDAQGDQSAKANALSYEDKDKFIYVPGFYEGDFVMTTGSDRKPTLKLTDVKCLCEGNVFPCGPDGKPFPSIPKEKDSAK